MNFGSAKLNKFAEEGRFGRFAFGVFLRIVIAVCSVLLLSRALIRNLGAIIALASPGSKEIAAVFGQLTKARISYPILIIVAAVILWALFYLPRRKAPNKGLRVALKIVLWIVIFAAVLFFINVNGIRFGDVLKSLLSYVRGGLLDAL